jgi:hypothetical protein
MEILPVGLGHGQPMAVSFEPPFQHPFRLVLFGRNKTDDLLTQTHWGAVHLNVCGKPVFILLLGYLFDDVHFFSVRHSIDPFKRANVREISELFVISLNYIQTSGPMVSA